MRRYFTLVSGWYILGVLVLALTALGTGMWGHHPWRGLGFGWGCIIWARVEQMDQRYRSLVRQQQGLLEFFIAVVSRESGDDTGVPRP